MARLHSYNDTLSKASRGVSANMFGMVDEHYPCDFPPDDGDSLITDSLRFQEWMDEFTVFEHHHFLTTIQVIALPGDRSDVSLSDKKTDMERVKANDAALGEIVDSITHSEFWKESAIFVVESAGGGKPDHVDPHRTTALVISPYVKRGNVDHTMYTTSSMLKTIERIVGIPPMSQYDESAPCMCDVFTSHPHFTPFSAVHSTGANLRSGSNNLEKNRDTLEGNISPTRN